MSWWVGRGGIAIVKGSVAFARDCLSGRRRRLVAGVARRIAIGI